VTKGYPKKRFFYTGQGLGPFSESEIKIVKNISKAAGYFGVRDECFKNKTESIFTFDESVGTYKESKNIRRKKEIWVNFRIANHVGIEDSKIRELLHATSQYAIKNGYKLVFFPMIEGVNFSEKAEIIRMIKSCGINSEVLNRPKNYRKLLKRINRASMVITTSYHATTASLYDRVPVLSIFENEYYRFKFEGLKDAFNSPLLNIFDMTNGKISTIEFNRIIESSDPNIRNRLLELKVLNDKAHNEIQKNL
jgi:polysaccharide pyruvyl transferase WcaK-like protein